MTHLRPIHLQRGLALIFLGLGAFALFFPGFVESVGLREEHRIGTLASAVLIGCFGAQAVLCGVLMWTCVFTARTFLVFGLVGSLPFFAFNYWLVFVEPVFTAWMLLDFVGNVGIFSCGVLGWWLSRNEGRAASVGGTAQPVAHPARS